jgi:hypothetical protein
MRQVRTAVDVPALESSQNASRVARVADPDAPPRRRLRSKRRPLENPTIVHNSNLENALSVPDKASWRCCSKERPDWGAGGICPDCASAHQGYHLV